MAIIDSLGLAVHVRAFRHNASGSNWSLIVCSDGRDALHARMMVSPPLGTTYVTVPRFGPEGFASVYAFGCFPFGNFGVGGTLELDTGPLDPSSARLELRGDDLLCPQHVLLWGVMADGAVVPMTMDLDVDVNLSDDEGEGFGSMPLRLVDSGNDATRFNEVVAFVSLANNANAPTRQPVSLRVEGAEGDLVWASGLEGFHALEQNGRNGKIWWLSDTNPFSRADALGPVVPKLSVDGPDDIQIQAIVAFGVNRDRPRPLVVPLVHHVPALTESNPWVGTSTTPEGRELTLPLCSTAAR